MSDVSGSDEDMSAEEFDRRFAMGEAVKLRRGPRPVSVIFRKARISAATISAQLASDSVNTVVAQPRPSRVSPHTGEILITSGLSTS
jgi:hypothetical protein